MGLGNKPDSYKPLDKKLDEDLDELLLIKREVEKRLVILRSYYINIVLRVSIIVIISCGIWLLLFNSRYYNSLNIKIIAACIALSLVMIESRNILIFRSKILKGNEILEKLEFDINNLYK